MLPDREEAAYFLNDLENILGKEVLFFPASCRKAFDFTQPDNSMVLQRAELLNELKKTEAAARLVVTYPEALSEKVINRNSLEKNTLEISEGDKLDIEFIADFLTDYEFNRVDFVYAPGQFAVRGGIVDIFSFSHFRPYRIEFFGDTIESIRDFEIEDQLSVAKFKHITVVPNVRAKFLSDEKISLLEYLGADCVVWIKDAQMTLDVVKNGYKKSKELWEAIPEADKNQNPEWLNPNQQLLDEKMLASQLQDFTIVEFGKQFFYKAGYSFSFEFSPQPSFNKDFSLLIHNLKKNEAEQIENYIFTDSAKQSERLYSIFEDLDKTVKFTPIHLSLREGFVDRDQKLACYTDHQIFDRYYKYQTKKAYVRSLFPTFIDLSL